MHARPMVIDRAFVRRQKVIFIVWVVLTLCAVALGVYGLYARDLLSVIVGCPIAAFGIVCCVVTYDGIIDDCEYDGPASYTCPEGDRETYTGLAKTDESDSFTHATLYMYGSGMVLRDEEADIDTGFVPYSMMGAKANSAYDLVFDMWGVGRYHVVCDSVEPYTIMAYRGGMLIQPPELSPSNDGHVLERGNVRITFAG